MTTKSRRQHAILRLVSDTEVANQAEVREMLAKQGIRATQATISRDFEELGIVKVRGAEGRHRYARQDPEPRALPEQLRRVMSEWVMEVIPSGSLVVVRTPPGCAHVVASALDRSTMSELVGTVAGDDTVLCVAAEAVGGRGLADLLRDIAGMTARTSPSVAGTRTARVARKGSQSGRGR